MTSLLTSTALNPLLTGSLLLWLRSKSPHLDFPGPLRNHPRIIAVLSLLRQPRAVTALKWLLALSIVSRVNRLLTTWALNNWKVDSGSRTWIWDREIAVVTGGSSGIGLELVKKLAANELKVAVIDITPLPPALKSLRNVSFFRCDITKQDELREAASEIKNTVGTPSVLVNNAGIARTHDILDATDEQLTQMFRINLLSHWFTVQEFLPDMIKNKKGHIVTIASMASYTTVAGMVDYCSTKHGVLSFHEGLNQELKHRLNAPFIKTTSVHPFWVRTPLLRWEKTITEIGDSIMTPEFVASSITKAIMSGNSGQLILPSRPDMFLATLMKGLPHWFGEVVRDSTSKVTVDQYGPKSA